MKLFYKIYRLFLIFVNMPIILSDFFSRRTGKEYGVGFVSKIILVIRMILNNFRVISGSNFLEHLTMATRIFNIPKSVQGCVVECGCYKGGSTVNLSLVSALCGRELEVFDSFEGLPNPAEIDKKHILIDFNETHQYAKGSWAGTLNEVKTNITKYGKIDVCNFNCGYFDRTLPSFKRKCVFAFLDVDLRRSLEECVRYLWPLLYDGSYLFTHESTHMEIASLFFDNEWWSQNLKCKPSGLVGAGNGLGLLPHRGAYRSAIGYTVKNPSVIELKENPQIGYVAS